MPNPIKIKSSTTPAAVPATLAEGEIAMNRSSGKLFYLDASNSVTSIQDTLAISATQVTSGTLSDGRLSDKSRTAANLYLWSSFR